jgi:hypothetical protein
LAILTKHPLKRHYSAIDGTDINLMKFRLFRELFLTQLCLFTTDPDSSPQEPGDILNQAAQYRTTKQNPMPTN